MDASRMCGQHPFRFSGEIRVVQMLVWQGPASYRVSW